MNEGIALRGQLMEFAVAMELKLRENDWKSGWEKDKLKSLMMRLHEEVSELECAVSCLDFVESDLYREITIRSILAEACDVANLAMMIFDNTKRM
jgi:hypothetical protein